MGFFNTFTNTLSEIVKISFQTALYGSSSDLEKIWKEMSELSKSELSSICEQNRGLNKITLLALLKLATIEKSCPKIFDKDRINSARRGFNSINEIIGSSKGVNFEEIRRAIDFFNKY